jgi:hypothetical protein
VAGKGGVKGGAKTPGSGRKKGTVNKDKQELRALLEGRFPGYHPVVAMAEIATAVSEVEREDGSIVSVPLHSIETRMMAHREVAKYVEPQLTAVEHRAGDEVKGLNFFMGFTEERMVSRPEVKGNGKSNGAGGNGAAARPRPRAGQ